jgi:hypothetical protein
MALFRINRYTDDGDIMLNSFKELKNAGGGLPPMTSQTIMMNEKEIDELIKVLQDYANERRNP